MSKFGKWHYDGSKLIRDGDGKVIADILPSLDDFDSGANSHVRLRRNTHFQTGAQSSETFIAY